MQRSSGTSAPPAPRVPRQPSPPRERATLSEEMARKEPSDRDMRSKRPPAMSFLLRMATARRLARVLSLLALDFVGVALALITARVVKAAVLEHDEPSSAFRDTNRIL